jgi:hypothetical protein
VRIVIESQGESLAIDQGASPNPAQVAATAVDAGPAPELILQASGPSDSARAGSPGRSTADRAAIDAGGPMVADMMHPLVARPEAGSSIDLAVVDAGPAPQFSADADAPSPAPTRRRRSRPRTS